MNPLVFAEENKELIIKELKGRAEDKAQLCEKGFCVGNKICLMKNDHGKCVVKINGCKYALDFATANKIMVE